MPDHITKFVCVECKEKIRYVIKDGCGGTGYGLKENGGKVCYPCCGKLDTNNLNAGEVKGVPLYLTEADGKFNIANWCGTVTIKPRAVNRKKRGHFVPGRGCVERIDVWFKSPDGTQCYHGVVRGDMQLMRCRKVSGKDWC